MVSRAKSNVGCPLRADIDPSTRWDLTQLFASEAEVSAALAELKTLIEQYAPFKGHIADSAEALLNYLRFSESVQHKFERVWLYAFLWQAEDAGNESAASLNKGVDTFRSEMATASAFAFPELTQIDEPRLEQFIVDEPELAVYRHYFANLSLDRPHVRPELVEEVIAQSSPLLSAAASLFASTTQLVMPSFMPRVPVKFKNGRATKWQRVSDGNLLVLLQHSERVTRQKAFEGVMGTYAQFAPTLAANFIAGVESQIFMARARKFGSVLEMKLAEPRLPVGVYDSLIETARANRRHLQRYLELRRRLLGVQKLHMYDLYAPLLPGFEQVVEFDQAKRTVLEALSVFGKTYVDRLSAMFESKRVDRAASAGKKNGAFCAFQWGWPGYILLNFNGLLRDMFTLAHEGGHARHYEEANGTQPFVYRDYPIFCAETASTVNEQLLAHHLIKNASNPQMRLHLLNQALESFRGAVIRQTMFAEFERRVYKLAEGEGCKKTPLTLELLCDLYVELVRDYYGPNVVIDECVKYEWLKIPHLVNTPFYVYTYATGLSAAVSLARNIIKNGQKAVDDYFGFLRAGSSRFPLDSLREAGVDMSTSEPIQIAFDYFGEIIDLMEAELATIAASER